MSITGEQLRAGRAMVRWEQGELAQKAGVSTKTVKRLEAMTGRLDARSTYSLTKALELGGVEFLDAEDFRGRGEGVRFRTDRTAKLRRLIIEDVTGQLEVGLQLAAEKDQDLFERPISEVIDLVLTEVREAMRRKLQFHLGKNGD